MIPRASAEVFTGLAGRVARTFEPYTEADSAAVVAQFLVGFGNALGRTAHLQIGETRHYLNENVLIVGASAHARKGDGKNVALRPLQEADPDWAQCNASGLSSGEGLISATRDALTKPNPKGEVVTVDEGASDKRLLVVEAEFSQPLKMFARDGNTLSNTIRDAWDGKATLRTLTKTSPTKATGAHISIVGHTTPEDLGEYLDTVEVANGLGNRFLFVWTHRARQLPNPGRVPRDQVDRLVEDVRDALAFARGVGAVERTAGAAMVWADIYPELTRERPALVGKLLARAEAHVARMSALYALTSGSAVVDTPHLEAALALWDYCEASVLRIFAGRTGNTLLDRLLLDLLPGQRATLTELHEMLGRNVTAGRLRAAVRK